MKKSIFKMSLKGIIFMVLLVGAFMTTTLYPPAPAVGAAADTQNYSEVVTGVQIISLPTMGIYTATRTGLVEFQIPFKAKVLGVSAKARASSGTSPTLTVDIKEGGTSILSAPFSVYSTETSSGTLSDTTLADESTISLDLNIGGTSPVWQDIMTILTIRRTN